ncbi:MAG: Ycf66 family protein [Leptolyngbyaceae bacterium]|nr:Ycf66 family protein [Leptolyngbyaceae bacterium]
MVNSDFGPAFILGVALVLSGVALYGMRSFRPELSRDHDIFFAAIALVSGLILIFQGWRLDPLLFLGQLSLAGSAGFFAFENIRLRGVTTEQAKKNTPIVDDDRPVSRRYEYDYEYDSEFDELPSRERRTSRSIRASRDSRAAAFEDDYRSERPRRTPSPSSSRRRRLEPDEDYRRPAYDPEPRPRRRLPRARRPEDERPVEPAATWDERPVRDEWDERPQQTDRPTWDVNPLDAGTDSVTRSDDAPAPSGAGSTYRAGGREPKSLSRYRRRRASSSGGSSYRSGSDERASESYADYQPLNESGADDDNY